MESFIDIDFQEEAITSFTDHISKEMAKALPAANSNLEMVVIIPAKDEAQHIKLTLESFKKQLCPNGKLFDNSRFEILVLCHNCSDSTQEEVERFFLTNGELNGYALSLNSDVANTVGAARRILMNIASDRIRQDNGLIISTDADTKPDEYWLYHLAGYLNLDVGLICGLILSDSNELSIQARNYLIAKDEYLLLKSRLESLLLPNPNDPWPRHGYHWGPNIAIKKGVYKAIGGIRPLHFLEDVDLYNRVVSEGFVARHCLNSTVITSTRIQSKCPEGFGAELRDWTYIEGVSYNVEGLQKLLLRFQIYIMIKRYFLSKSNSVFNRIAKLSLLDPNDLRILLESSPRVECLVLKMEAVLNKSEKWNATYPNTDVFKTCEDLKEYLKNDLDANYLTFFHKNNSYRSLIQEET